MAAEAEAGGDGGGGVDAEFGDGAVDQGGEAEDEADDAGEARVLRGWRIWLRER